MNPTIGADSSQTTNLDANMSTPRTPPVSGMSTAVGRLPKVNFHVEFDLGREDGAQSIRMTIPKDESYDKFLGRLRNIFCGDSCEKSLRRWEYTLVNRQYEKAHPLPLTSPNTYYAMVSELLCTRSRWRHALIRRSHFENPILKAVAEGKFHLTPASQLLDAAATDTSLPGNLLINDGSKPDISINKTSPVADAVQRDASNADTPMPDAPTDEITPEVLTSKPASKAWVVKPASATSSIVKHTRHPSTPSTSVARGRLSSQSNPPLAPALRAQDLLRPHSPLISSPLKPSPREESRCSALLSSSTAPVTIAPKPRRRSSPLAPVATAQSLIPLEPSPLATDISTQPPRNNFTSPSTPSAIAQRPARSINSTRSSMAGVKDSSKQLDSMSATAAIEQDPTKWKVSSESPVIYGPNLFAKLLAPLASTTSAQGISLQPSSPSMPLSLPITPAACTQPPPAILPLVPDPSALQKPASTELLEEGNSPLASALEAPRPSGAPGPKLFQRLVSCLGLALGAIVLTQLHPPPRPTSTFIPEETPPANRTLILPPRRPLWIISIQRLNHATEYHVHWNNGRNSWVAHDSLYRDYPAFVDRYLREQR